MSVNVELTDMQTAEGQGTGKHAFQRLILPHGGAGATSKPRVVPCSQQRPSARHPHAVGPEATAAAEGPERGQVCPPHPEDHACPALRLSWCQRWAVGSLACSLLVAQVLKHILYVTEFNYRTKHQNAFALQHPPPAETYTRVGRPSSPEPRLRCGKGPDPNCFHGGFPCFGASRLAHSDSRRQTGVP